MTKTGKTKMIPVLDAMEPKDIGEHVYYPIGRATDLDRAFEEARLFRRLSYRARVMKYHYPHDPIDTEYFIVMVATHDIYKG